MGKQRHNHGKAKGRSDHDAGARAKPRREKKRGQKTGLFGSASDLRLQLSTLGLRLAPVNGDGNCLFRALADQVYGDESQHSCFRELACAWLSSHAEEVRLFLDEDEDGTVEQYCATMAKDATWGGNMEIVALSAAMGTEVVVHQSGHPSYTVCHGSRDRGVLHVGYSDGDHYDSVRLEGDKGGAQAWPIKLPSTAGERASVAAGLIRQPFPPPEKLVQQMMGEDGGGAGQGDGPEGQASGPQDGHAAGGDGVQLEDDAEGGTNGQEGDSKVAEVGDDGGRPVAQQADGAAGPSLPSPRTGQATPLTSSTSGQSNGAPASTAKGATSWAERKRAEAALGKPKRNAPCPCGSHKAYKKCCEGVDKAADTKAKAIAKRENGRNGAGNTAEDGDGSGPGRPDRTPQPDQDESRLTAAFAAIAI